ncbi:MAG: hypothetical protein HUJ51_01270 [Eggerthellaceae bacterium]|nr:hypothetical protein [Eggerthellaceae bacterium]
MEIKEQHSNFSGGLIGGTIFTLSDPAFAVLANQIHGPNVAQSANINFFGRT